MTIVPAIGERLVSADKTPEELSLECSLRPRLLAEYIGQEELKAQIAVAIAAAKLRGEALDHLLLHGPAGLGKTTLAQISAAEMSSRCHVTSAPSLERPRDIAGLLARLAPGDVLFIDEIHRLSPLAEELLYPAMEDFMLDLTIGKGQAARIRRVPLARFTLVGATTRPGTLSGPLRDRFGMACRLRFYLPEELSQIIERSASVLKITINGSGALAIAQCSRGTPRVAIRLLRRVRDYAQVAGSEKVTAAIAQHALSKLQIDELGLDPLDRELLSLIVKQHAGGPVGIEALAAEVGVDLATIEDVVEPYLLQAGLLRRTPRGRMATSYAYHHIGEPEPVPVSTLKLWESS
ncbi:MAG: Holliday junction branch migration DNA helicase RuvB [Cyanobacteria bacterium NC_groundwater_1444_Ag_S-0.65um_54_12]|nr:Holliday junction branch migration DNA helicase RuvB [Cyanobacteria bacterium NC_groundwater_1444_Ag_S-0.65um_54_12]